jgi:HlyD family secretion protein
MSERGQLSAPKELSDRVRSLRLTNRETSAANSSRLAWLPWIFCIVLLFTSVAFGYRAYRVGGLSTSPTAATATPAGYATTPSGQSVELPASGAVAAAGEVVLQSKGYVIPKSLVQVSPKVGGQLIWINDRFEEGRRFKKGDKLAEIEKTEYQAEFDQAESAYLAACERYQELVKTRPEEIKQAEAELEEARQTGLQLQLEYERNQRLASTRAVPLRELEQAQYSSEANKARLRRLEATLRLLRDGRLDRRIQAAEFEMKQAKGVLDRARWRLENTIITAPIDGTILTKKAELGNMVNPSAFSSGISASLCEMADLTKLEIDLSIQERDIAAVKVGQECQIMPEAYQNDPEFLSKHPRGYRGVVSRLMPTADRAKGAIPVRVAIAPGEIPEAEAGLYLRPDMSALVSFKRSPTATTAGEPTRTSSN